MGRFHGYEPEELLDAADADGLGANDRIVAIGMKRRISRDLPRTYEGWRRLELVDEYNGGHVHSSRKCSERFGAQGDVEAGAVARQAHQEDAGPFKDVGHFQPSCVEGPHVQAL